MGIPHSTLCIFSRFSRNSQVKASESWRNASSLLLVVTGSWINDSILSQQAPVLNGLKYDSLVSILMSTHLQLKNDPSVFFHSSCFYWKWPFRSFYRHCHWYWIMIKFSLCHLRCSKTKVFTSYPLAILKQMVITYMQYRGNIFEHFF